jgi:Predicted acetyltransferase
MNTGLFPAYAEREPELMARWFADDSSHPLIILKDEQPVGFALVSRPPRNRREQFDYCMAEFFVVASARRRGVGRDAAHLIFNRFAGNWLITEFAYNKAAVAFWRAIISDYTGGRFRETLAYGEIKHMFRSRTAGRE